MKSSKREIIIVWLIPYLALALLHILLGLKMQQPSVFADELGYLGNARYLSGVGHMPDLRSCAFYHFGYSLFLLPAFWLFSDPTSAYKLVIVINALLISSLYYVIIQLLNALFECPKKVSGIISFTCCLYPAFVLQSNFAWSENAFIPFYALFIALFATLLNRKSVLTSVLFGLVAGFLYTIHPRALPVIPIVILFLCILAGVKVLPKSKALIGIVAVTIVFIVTRLVNDHLIALGWGGVNHSHDVMGKLSRTSSLSGLINLVLAASGQLLYLGQATYGLFFIGGISMGTYVWSRVPRGLRGSFMDNRFNVLLLLLLTSIGIFLASNVQMAHGERFDHFIYGRYNEGFLSLYLAFALFVLYSEKSDFFRKVLRPLVVIVIIAILTSVVILGRSEQIQSAPVNQINIMSIYPFIEMLGKINLSIISLISIMLFIIILFAFRIKTLVGMVFLMAIFLFLSLQEYSSFFLRHQKYVQRVSTLASHIHLLEDIKHLSYDWKFFNSLGWFSYQYLLPNATFERFNSSQKQVPSAQIVISGMNWPDSRRLRAQFIISENRADQVLWVLPGEIQDNIIDGLNFCGVNLGGNPVNMVWESGFHVTEGESGNYFRWTKGAAKLVVPISKKHMPKALRIKLWNGLPRGTELKVVVNGQTLFGEKIPGGEWDNTFSLKGVSFDKWAIIEFLSGMFVPKETLKGSEDTRKLGVLVKEVMLLE